MLILAHRPFPEAQPYAETGPIFLCADPCERGMKGQRCRRFWKRAPDYLIKGYSARATGSFTAPALSSRRRR